MTAVARWIRLAVTALLAVVVTGVVGRPDVAGQAPLPPILVVVNASSPNPFGGFIGEILRAEGLNAFEVVELSALTATRLAASRVAILAETPLTSTQAGLFTGFVAGGGRLVAMRPDPALAPLFDVTVAGTTTANGYVAINQAVPTGAGLSALTLPVLGAAEHYTPLAGATTLATLYADRTTATPYAAVARNAAGTATAWAFDLARSVAYARQGDPAFAGAERDGHTPYTTMEPFFGNIDLVRIRVPHADIQMRLFARAVADHLADHLPMPRLWYFPAAHRTMMVVTGDSHVANEAAYTQLRTKVESLGGRMSFYLARYLTYPDAATAAAWRQTGHELSMHPYGTTDGEAYAQSFQTARNWFTQAGLGTPGPTVRNHRLEWEGWTDGAAIAANEGHGMETSAYSWGPAMGPFMGTQAKGYITGSGRPMRFVTTSGQLLPIFQQATQFIDHQLFVTDGFSENPETYTVAEGLAFSQQMLQASVDEYHSAIVTQFHLDYYLYEQVKNWVDGTLDLAAGLGIPLWSGEQWLRYVSARDQATFSGLAWAPASGELTFTLQAPAGASALSTMLPVVYGGETLASVEVNGTPVPIVTRIVNGRSFAFFPVGPLPEGTTSPVAAAYTVVARYDNDAPDTTPPAIGAVSATAATSSSAAVTWTTDEPATSRVEYGIGNTGTSTALNPALTLSHGVTLTGLAPSTTYQYRVVSSDEAGNTSTSAVQSFTTPAPAPLPTLSITGNATAEGAGAVATFQVTLSAPSADTVTVQYATVNGTAQAGADFVATGGSLAFAPGETSRTITVALIDDSVTEGEESFSVTLSSPQNATIATATATITVLDNDAVGPQTLTIPIASASDDVNEDGGSFDPSGSTVWVGTGSASNTSYTGLRFASVAIPRGATIQSARVEVNAAATQWLGMAFEIGVEAAGDSAAFSAASRPSQRTLLTPRVAHLSDAQWVTGTWYQLDSIAVPLQALVNRADWNPGAAATVVLRGTGNAWGRKQVRSFETSASLAPRLVVTFLAGPPPPPSVSVNDVSVTEGTGGSTTAVFTVSLSGASASTVTVNYATGGGTATAGSDYTAASGTLTFAPGETSKPVAVAVAPDAVLESNETFQLTLSAPVNAVIGTATGTATIVDDDAPPLPALSINDVTVTEGTGGSSTAVFTVQLSAPSATTVTVAYATNPGTATATLDYVPVTGATLTFAPGVSSQTIAVSIVTDSAFEPDETFTVVLSAPTNATIADATGVGTITDDDAGSGPVSATFPVTAGADDVNEDGASFDASGSTVWLGAGASAASSVTGLRFTGVTIPRNAIVTSARLVVTAAQTQWMGMQFEFGIQDSGNAPAFTDASRPSQRTLATPRVAHNTNQQWVAGTTYTLEELAPLVQHVVSRGDWASGNAVALVLRATGGAWARKFAQAFEAGAASAPRLAITYQVAGGDTPTINIGDVTVTEGTGGGATASFTATLSTVSAQTVTVNYATANGTATAGSDYTAATGQLTFAPGVTSQTIAVAVTGDALSEPTETFSVVLSGAVNAQIGDGIGVATILDDDVFLPTINVANVSAAENVAGGSIAFVVTLTGPSTQTVTASYTTVAATATAGTDFTAAAGTVTFAPGVTSQLVPVALIDDGIAEPSETFSLVLSSPVNAVLGTAAGVATITDDDGAPSGPVTSTFQIAAAADDVNEDGASFEAGSESVWLGSGSSTTGSYTGLRFTGVTVPRNAIITSARLEVNAATTQWIGMAFQFGIEATGNSAPFSASALPSQRVLLAPRVSHLSDGQWLANTWYTLDEIGPIVQALVDRPDWASGNALSLVIRGTGSAWARKPGRSFESGAAFAPRLVVTYTVP